MTAPIVPLPRLPHVTLPTIRGVSAIPHVGSPGASATTYVGEQFGNLPDFNLLAHIKTAKKALNEQIYALIEGKLPDPARPIPYDARAVQLTSEVADLMATFNDVVTTLSAELNAGITVVNGKLAEMNAAKAAIESIPVGARGAVQRLMAQRYTRYASELNAQANRLTASIASLAA